MMDEAQWFFDYKNLQAIFKNGNVKATLASVLAPYSFLAIYRKYVANGKELHLFL